MKNQLCDYLQIPGEDISDEGPPVSVGVPLETVAEEISEEEIKAKIEESIALRSELELKQGPSGRRNVGMRWLCNPN